MRRRLSRILVPAALLLFAGFGTGFFAGGTIRENRAARLSAMADPESGGCLLRYRISTRRLLVQTPGGVLRVFDDVLSGDGLAASVGKAGAGPLPPGVYRVFTRDGGAPTFFGQPAFLLDPVDAAAGNDRIDGPPAEAGGGRSAFRIHGGRQTEGCLASERIAEIAALLLRHLSEKTHDIYSHPANSGRPGMKRYRETAPGEWEAAREDGDWELFEAERCAGLLWVTE